MASVNLGFDLDQLQKLVTTVKEDPQAGNTVWEVDTAWKGGFKSEAHVHSYGRSHTIRMDEPAPLGGHPGRTSRLSTSTSRRPPR